MTLLLFQCGDYVLHPVQLLDGPPKPSCPEVTNIGYSIDTCSWSKDSFQYEIYLLGPCVLLGLICAEESCRADLGVHGP